MGFVVGAVVCALCLASTANGTESSAHETPLIAIVRGTLSATSAEEATYCSNTAERVSGWLSEIGVGHDVVDDQSVVDGGLTNYALAVLPLNPDLPDEELDAIEVFVGNGGKLLLFYASSPRLARLLGVRIGTFSSDPSRTKYCTMRASKTAPSGMPERIVQSTPHVIPVYPDDDASFVASWWEGMDGHVSDTPAWVCSSNGAWMSYILLDGEAMAKRGLLFSWIRLFMPTVEGSLPPGVLDGVESSFAKVEHSLRDAQTGAGTGERSTGRASMQMRVTRTAKGRMDAALADGDVALALAEAANVRRLLSDVYALLQVPSEGEFRGIWDHSGQGLYPGDWHRTCALLRRSGFTAIFPNMLSAAYAHYESEVLPPSSTFAAHGDQIGAVVLAAKQARLEVHVWKVCWRGLGASPGWHAEMAQAGRLQVDALGSATDWLCPSHPDNVEQEKMSVLEVCTRYNVDGVHLDYIRYPEAGGCFCERCRALFEEDIRSSSTNWPTEAVNGRLAEAFRRWRADRMTAYVGMLRGEMKRTAPSCQLSAAVFGHYETAYGAVGQDWHRWLAEGSLDFVCPMNYTDDLRFFRALLDAQMPSIPTGVGYFPGIGIHGTASLDPIQTIDQIRTLREKGVGGFVIFDLSPALAKDSLPLLRKGITRPVQAPGW